MFVRANFVDIYSQGMRDRSMRSGTELAREIKLTDWSMAGNLSNRSSGVQIPRDICTRLKRYLYSAKCSWIIKCNIFGQSIFTSQFISMDFIINDSDYSPEIKAWVPLMCDILDIFLKFSLFLKILASY